MRARLAAIWISAFLVVSMLVAGEPDQNNTPPPAVCKRKKCPAADLVNRWFAEGTAAGNAGDLYDNRCGGHSLLRLANYPQLKQYQYTEKQKAARLHWGLFRGVRKGIVLGNSSTSAPPHQAGSNIRQAYSSHAGLSALYRQYRANNLYVYPEHKDHDPGMNGRNGWGDLFPTNTPYVVASQGSSGSDKAYLRAFALTLAAFRPEVKRRLAAAGLLMPTVQYIFRMSYKGVQSPDVYRTGRAHPTAFWAPRIDEEAMVRLAHDMTSEAVPPLVQLRVVEEDDEAVPGTDHFAVGDSEVLGNTPCVIARVHRRLGYTKRLVVSAAASKDLHGKPLTFHWVLLRGDPGRVRITPRDDGTTAEIEVDYHPRLLVKDETLIESTRVDIGVFVHNGVYDSAPGFITVHYPLHQRRTYDAAGRLLEAWYSAADVRIGHPRTVHWTGLHLTGKHITDPYDIADWSLPFALLDPQNETPPARWYRERYDANTRERLRALGEAFLPVYARYREARVSIQDRAAELRRIDKEKKEAWNRLRREHRQAKRALAKTPDDAEKKAALEAIKEKMPAARDAHRKASKALRESLAPMNKLALEAEGMLVAFDPHLAEPPRVTLEDGFNRMVHDPRFYADRAAVLDEMVAEIPEKDRESIAAEKTKAMEAGVLVHAGGEWTLASAVAGAAPAAERLTRYERYLLARFHLALLRHAVYPGCVKAEPSSRLVEALLAAPIDWRDVYRRDGDGTLLGWTRHRDGRTERFTADGHLVETVDDLGRPARARAVDYVTEYVYRDKSKAVGRVRFDGTGCSVFLGDRKLVDRSARGAGVKPQQVQFLVFKDRPADAAPYVVDVNHFDESGRQTGWTRFDGGAVFEFARKDGAEAFVGHDAAGKEVSDPELDRQLAPSKKEILMVPGDAVWTYAYQDAADRRGTAKLTASADSGKPEAPAVQRE